MIPSILDKASIHENNYSIIKVLEKILDWKDINPNRMLRACENVSRSFKNLNLVLGKHFKKILKTNKNIRIAVE